MPICPYCKKELRLKLSAQFIAEIDPLFYDVVRAQLQRGPKIFQGFMNSQLEKIGEYPIMIMIIACAECDAALSLTESRKD